MKAIVYDHYGPPDVLQYAEIEKPVPSADQVLLQVRASSVNPYDWHFIRGTPSFIRLFTGLRAPKSRRLGADVAGVVEAAGSSVTSFKAGDAVFGTAAGSFAEYVCASPSTLALKPENLTWEQAASAPIAGITALQGPARQSRNPRRPACPHQRRIRRRWNIRRADRQIAEGPRHRRLQHQKHPACPLPWR